VSLKACKSCMSVKYCNSKCQKNHWPTHKTACKERAAELHDEVLFKDPPAKEDCPICFLPMPKQLICCVSLPPATISSVPVYDYAKANEEVASTSTSQYYSCCGKSICAGCLPYVTPKTGKYHLKCPYCNSDRDIIIDEELLKDIRKRVEANDPASTLMLAQHYRHGDSGLQQDRAKATELYTKAAELGSAHAHFFLGQMYVEGGNVKKAKFHYEATAMAGCEVARYELGCLEGTKNNNLGAMAFTSDNVKRAIKHWTIAASAGEYRAMNTLIDLFKKGLVVNRESIDLTLTAYNNSCAEMRSKDRDATIRGITETRLGEDGKWERKVRG